MEADLAGTGLMDWQVADDGYFKGRHYNGQWKNDLFHGLNHFWDSDLEGKGVLTTPLGTYEGQFEQGDEHGQGTMTYKDGSVYKGSFEEGAPHGQGTMTYKDGSVYKGSWHYGQKTAENKISKTKRNCKIHF